MICEHCGAEKPVRYNSGELTFIAKPVPGLFWKGKRIPLTAQQLDIMGPLVQHGNVSHDWLETRVAADAIDARKSIATQVSKIRWALGCLGVPHRIINAHGIGYRLEVPHSG